MKTCITILLLVCYVEYSEQQCVSDRSMFRRSYCSADARVTSSIVTDSRIVDGSVVDTSRLTESESSRSVIQNSIITNSRIREGARVTNCEIVNSVIRGGVWQDCTVYDRGDRPSRCSGSCEDIHDRTHSPSLLGNANTTAETKLENWMINKSVTRVTNMLQQPRCS